MAIVNYMYRKQDTVDGLVENEYHSQMLAAKRSPHQARTVPQCRVSSDTLLGPRRELVIVHAGREYRLRLTQNGKLILTASPRDPGS